MIERWQRDRPANEIQATAAALATKLISAAFKGAIIDDRPTDSICERHVINRIDGGRWHSVHIYSMPRSSLGWLICVHMRSRPYQTTASQHWIWRCAICHFLPEDVKLQSLHCHSVHYPTQLEKIRTYRCCIDEYQLLATTFSLSRHVCTSCICDTVAHDS